MSLSKLICFQVNLPAHLVIIKSTAHYVMGVFQEYSETQILQMIGRAGRPQVYIHLKRIYLEIMLRFQQAKTTKNYQQIIAIVVLCSVISCFVALFDLF